MRPTETSHYIRIYDKDTVKMEKMLVQLINMKNSVYDYEFYSQVLPGPIQGLPASLSHVLVL